MTQIYSGAIDTRTAQQKKNDYTLLEIAGSTSVSFEERIPVFYTVRDQDGSGSCVAQTTAKMLEVWDFKNDNSFTVYSASPIYQSRSNKPQSGMIGVEALAHPIKNGTFLESEVPSQNMNDIQMDMEILDGVKQKVSPTNYVVVPSDFYSVAGQVKNTGAVMLWFKCSYSEWSKDVPEGLSNSTEVRHSVCAIDTIKFKNKEYIIIEDSWGTWQQTSDVPLHKGQRAITKEFFDKHCYFAGVYTTFVYEDTTKPVLFFTRPLSFGQVNTDVNKLQKMLQYEKFFPSNITPTNYFGAITAKALKNWQVAHNIMDFASETNMSKIRFGAKSIALANNLYK